MRKLKHVWDFTREIYQIWVSEKPNQLAAALAYFGMVSFAAVIYLAYLIAGLFINEAAAGERLYARVEAVLGSETAAMIQDSVSALAGDKTGSSFIISAISLITLLFIAIGLFMQITYVLNRIWGVPLTQSKNIIALIRQHLFAFIMVIGLGLLVIVGTVLNMLFSWFGSIIKDVYGGSRLLSALNFLVLLGIIVMALAFMYRVLPNVKIAWRDVWPGSMVTSALVVLGGAVLSIYFRFGRINTGIEAAGAYALLMLAIYYFAQIFLFGAIFTRVYAHRFGSLSNSEPAADSLPSQSE